jgi:ribosomal protein L40E
MTNGSIGFETDVEFVKRKSSIIAQAIAVNVLCIFFIGISVVAGGSGAGWIFIISLIALIAGNIDLLYQWRKITHVVWTKQALAEFEMVKLAEGTKAAAIAQVVYSDKKCRRCGVVVAPDSMFCYKCGQKFEQ